MKWQAYEKRYDFTHRGYALFVAPPDRPMVARDLPGRWTLERHATRRANRAVIDALVDDELTKRAGGMQDGRMQPGDGRTLRERLGVLYGGLSGSIVFEAPAALRCSFAVPDPATERSVIYSSAGTWEVREGEGLAALELVPERTGLPVRFEVEADVLTLRFEHAGRPVTLVFTRDT